MRRRDFIILLGSVAASWPLVGRAQQAGNIPKVAVLWRAGSAEQEGSNFKSLVKGFNDLGYGEGRIMLEHRFPNEAPDRFKSLAAELVSWSADVLIGVGDSAAIYLKEASATTPLIFVLVADPLGSKLVDNRDRPVQPRRRAVQQAHGAAQGDDSFAGKGRISLQRK